MMSADDFAKLQASLGDEEISRLEVTWAKQDGTEGSLGTFVYRGARRPELKLYTDRIASGKVADAFDGIIRSCAISPPARSEDGGPTIGDWLDRKPGIAPKLSNAIIALSGGGASADVGK